MAAGPGQRADVTRPADSPPRRSCAGHSSWNGTRARTICGTHRWRLHPKPRYLYSMAWTLRCVADTGPAKPRWPSPSRDVMSSKKQRRNITITKRRCKARRSGAPLHTLDTRYPVTQTSLDPVPRIVTSVTCRGAAQTAPFPVCYPDHLGISSPLPSPALRRLTGLGSSESRTLV